MYGVWLKIDWRQKIALWTTVKKLTEAIISVWYHDEEIAKRCQKVFSSMPKRVKEIVIKKEAIYLTKCEICKGVPKRWLGSIPPPLSLKFYKSCIVRGVRRAWFFTKIGVRVEVYAYYVNKLRLKVWTWRQIVTSQTAHTKYKWPPYATEWNPQWKFSAYAEKKMEFWLFEKKVHPWNLTHQQHEKTENPISNFALQNKLLTFKDKKFDLTCIAGLFFPINNKIFVLSRRSVENV